MRPFFIRPLRAGHAPFLWRYRWDRFRVRSTGTDAMSASLREQVEAILPKWERWYPSLFDAAADLGLIKARVCSPDSLLLSNRHASVQSQAEAAHREKWGGTEEPGGDGRRGAGRKRRRRR